MKSKSIQGKLITHHQGANMPNTNDSVLDNEEFQRIFNALKSNPNLKNCFLEMIDIAQSPVGTLDCGDDAEEAVVNAIQKTGNLILQEWAQKKARKRLRKLGNNQKYVATEKKSNLANIFRYY